ncbi:MAG TPA: universal stress protein [Candidatus Avacidaminococcus intestinavium]|uniref:Universal stress protein n=1 Tax=Candidatus Avacidaminococcus intestinavium TaxID=2840684 RepID=A0A9D1MRI4_9FIRM|nr:universal stress protein [Candidatus Avacidaminococcus intestinavium]
MFKKILVPVDGSENAWHALQQATSIGEKFGSIIVVLNVIQPYNNAALLAVPFDYATINQGNDELAKIGDRVLAMAKEHLIDYEGETEYMMKIGHPSEKILDVAKRHECDAIVLGSRGLSSIAEFFLGSVSSKVSQYSTVPVLIVK